MRAVLIYTRGDIIDAIRPPFGHYIAAVYINSAAEMIARIISDCMANRDLASNMDYLTLRDATRE